MPRIYIHPLPVRVWHWLNALGFVGMILTGLQIRYVGLINVVPFRLAVQIHDWLGFALIANFCLWLGFYATSPRIRCYLPELNLRKYASDTIRQLRYYCHGMFRGDPNPHRMTIYNKFNPMQATLYQLVMVVLVPVQFATGVLLWDPARFSAPLNFFGGLRVVDTVHVLIFIFFVAYVLVHPYLGTLGATRTGQYKAMISGYEEVEDGSEAPPASKPQASRIIE
jgi:thiosulfate reductase cytochrome b subunit